MSLREAEKIEKKSLETDENQEDTTTMSDAVMCGLHCFHATVEEGKWSFSKDKGAHMGIN